MCMGGGGSAQVPVPEVKKLPPPLPAPPPPDIARDPQLLFDESRKPDIKIGAAKKAAAERKNRAAAKAAGVTASLSIGDSQGMTL